MTELQLTTFRGKLFDGRWIVGNYYFTRLLDAHMILATDGVKIYPREVHADTVGIRVEGILDKNGKDIFVGDVVEVDFGEDYGGKMLAQVIYNRKYASFNLKYTDGGVNMFPGEETPIKVIGNVYDNPKLLEVRHG